MSGVLDLEEILALKAIEDVFVRLNGQWKVLHRNNITFIPTLDLWMKKMKEGILTPEK